MNIDVTPVPVPDSRLEDLYDKVVPVQAEQARFWRLSALRDRWGFSLAMLYSTAMTVLLLAMLPNREYVPIVLFNGPNGFQFIPTSFSDLPPSVEIANIEARLWYYLQNREHYSSSEADDSYNTVSTMSDATVRDQYQRYANPKKNKEAPANMLGKDGWIRIFYRRGAFVTHEGDYSAGVYRIDYCRVSYAQGTTMRAQPFSAVIAYRLVRRIPLLQRLTTNPDALIVTQYPGAEEQAPAKDVMLGAYDPCAR